MDYIGGDGGVTDDEKEFTYSRHQELTHCGFKRYYLFSVRSFYVCGRLRPSAVNFRFCSMAGRKNDGWGELDDPALGSMRNFADVASITTDTTKCLNSYRFPTT